MVTRTPGPDPAQESDTEIEHDLEFIVAADTGDKANVLVHNKRVTNTGPGYCLLGLAAA